MELSRLTGVKALFFDVFGTTVDWRSTVTNFLHAEAQRIQLNPASNKSEAARKAAKMTLADWSQGAQQWRESYYAFCASIVNNPHLPYKTIDQHHHDSLRHLLLEWQLEGLWSEAEVERISLIWHKLNPWPDTVQGIKMLNEHFQTCTLSNGNVSLLQDMAGYANLDWTHIISAEMFGTYKPSPRVYLGAAERLGLQASECAMVAAHLNDLEAAKKCGFKTIYVERPQEEKWGQEKVAETRENGWVDLWIDDGNQGFITVASRM